MEKLIKIGPSRSKTILLRCSTKEDSTFETTRPSDDNCFRSITIIFFQDTQDNRRLTGNLVRTTGGQECLPMSDNTSGDALPVNRPRLIGDPGKDPYKRYPEQKMLDLSHNSQWTC